MKKNERQLKMTLYYQGETKPRSEWVLLIKPSQGPVRITECMDLFEAYARKDEAEDCEPIESVEIHAAAGGLAREFGTPITRRRRRRRKSVSATQLSLL